MKKLPLLLALFLALPFWQCQKDQSLYETAVVEDVFSFPLFDARSSECDRGMVPIKGELLELTDLTEFIFCTDPDGNIVGPPFGKTTQFIGGKLSHLGLINTDESGSLRVSCTNYGDRIVGYVTSHFVGANGDALDTQVELEVLLTPAPVFPEQILWNIVGGSGRFENTTGSFVTTFETVPNEPLQTRLQIISGCMTPPGISKHLDGE